MSEINEKLEKIDKSIDQMQKDVYDIVDNVSYDDNIKMGLSKEIVLEISKDKNEPEWMRNIRLEALEIFFNTPNPNWGPDLSDVDMSTIATYVSPSAGKTNEVEKMPEEIKNTFKRLGIQNAEEKYLGGVSFQYDSEEVYHNVKEALTKKGVIYMDMTDAVNEHEELVKKYFSKLIGAKLHKYAALHLAIWSGGSFVYIPKGVDLDIPIQSYYRFNAPGAGQFEHTLIVVEDNATCHYIEGCSAPRHNKVNVHAGSVEIFVGKNARMKFSTIENWSRNMYNLNTKRAIVEEDGQIEWVSGSFGSKVSMLYPTTILKGDRSMNTLSSVTLASGEQFIDNGSTNIILGKDTKTKMLSKSITKDNGVSITRNYTYIDKGATNAIVSLDCQSLMLSNTSVSDTIPVITVKNDSSLVAHEAKIGKIGEKEMFYLTSRGLTEDQATAMIVRGFANDAVTSKLPVEYAVELNNLIDLELEGSNG